MTFLVQKFGGSSLATIGDIRHCARLVAESRARASGVIVVVSAMGRRTDELVEMARAFGNITPCLATDALLAGGEQQSAAVIAIALQQQHQILPTLLGPAELGIATTAEFGDASIRLVDPAGLMKSLYATGVVVVPGFQGIGPDGNVRTLGRGGSDTTAVALAAALREAGHDCRCEIYTDVDAVCSADPRLIAAAMPLEHVDASWMSAYASEGAGVLHDRAAMLAERVGLPVQLGSARSGRIGTTIHAGGSAATQWSRPIGCTLRRGTFAQVCCHSRAANDLGASLNDARAVSISWACNDENLSVAAIVDDRGCDILRERWGRSEAVDIELQPVAIVSAVGQADAAFRSKAMRTQAQITASIDELRHFAFEGHIARWTADASAAERLYARVHDAMIGCTPVSGSADAMIEVKRIAASHVTA